MSLFFTFTKPSKRRIRTRPTNILLTFTCASSPRFNTTMPKPPPSRQISIPRPSSSIILLSPKNQVLLLHRVTTSSSFPSAHVFPGGNLDAFHDGDVADVTSSERHKDGKSYRLAGVRECFEETGILLARGKDGGLLDVEVKERELMRKRVHQGEVKFGEWVAEKGGVPDIDNLIPFTRWITPTNVPKRFTTQMYLYLLSSSSESLITATPDNGVEHTAAEFASPHAFLERARKGEIILFPPQYYLLSLLSQFLPHPSSSTSTSTSTSTSSQDYVTQRENILNFIQATPTAATESGIAHPTSSIPWAEKVMSPRSLFMREKDQRAVLGIDHPGPELKGSERGGDWERVVLARFTKGGPVEVEVRGREEMFEEERMYKAENGKGKL